MQQLKKVTIRKHEKITDGVYIISFIRDFEFIPGQIIGLTNNLEIPPRLYSICSSNNDTVVSILYQIKEEGSLTPLLEKNKPGDNLYITAVQGKFISGDTYAWWIATGTGIAPFYSMYKSGIIPQKLIQGGRFTDNIYFINDFKQLDDYTVCCSNDKGRGIYEGRLTKYLREYSNLPTDINYYLCGSAEMVVDVRNLLIEKGVNFNKIITEIYF